MHFLPHWYLPLLVPKWIFLLVLICNIKFYSIGCCYEKMLSIELMHQYFPARPSSSYIVPLDPSHIYEESESHDQTGTCRNIISIVSMPPSLQCIGFNNILYLIWKAQFKGSMFPLTISFVVHGSIYWIGEVFSIGQTSSTFRRW